MHDSSSRDYDEIDIINLLKHHSKLIEIELRGDGGYDLLLIGYAKQTNAL